jgi:uncharacterized protein
MKPWYQEGLRFKCTGCGKCCTGTPGYVWATFEEIQAMAKHFSLSVEEFSKKYVRKVGDRFALTEIRRGSNYDCVFLDGKRCTIYEVRPTQCRTYPWWKENISSANDWKEEAKRCEGINHPEAPLISIQEIQKHLFKENDE